MSSSYQPKTHRLEDLPDHFLRCRVYGHSWDQIPAILGDPDYMRLFRWYDVLRCVHCGCERYDGVNNNGTVGQRSYRYPDGYQTSFPLSRADARIEYLDRTRMVERPRAVS